MKNKTLITTSLIGVFTIILGAFGAHALKETLSSDFLKSFETAVRYQMYHVIVLLFVNTTTSIAKRYQKIISYLLYTGITLFSGSIYLITIFNIDAKNIWYLTPLGGLFLIVGWITICINYIKKS